MDTLSDTMLACQITQFNAPYTIHSVPVPKSLGPHDILLKVAAASLCHTDSMVSSGLFPHVHLPLTASHEGAGTAVALGTEVTGFKVGDRVLSGIARNQCGTCEDCRSPDHQYCMNNDGAIGITIDGAFAEFLVVDCRTAAKIPDEIGWTDASPMSCAGITAWRAVKQAGVPKGAWLGIVGSGGGLGHLAIKFVKAQGVKVIGIDARDEGLSLSRESGADIVLDARTGQESVVQEVQKVTDGKGVDVTINFSDASSAAGLACAVTRKHGRMVQVAQPQKVEIPFQQLIFRDIKIMGSLTGSRKETQEMLDFVAKHGITVSTFVYHGLKKIPQLVDDAHAGKVRGKGVVVLN